MRAVSCVELTLPQNGACGKHIPARDFTDTPTSQAFVSRFLGLLILSPLAMAVRGAGVPVRASAMVLVSRLKECGTQGCERQSKGTHQYGKRREDRESLVILVVQTALQ
jgi:hypothetical protein